MSHILNLPLPTDLDLFTLHVLETTTHTYHILLSSASCPVSLERTTQQSYRSPAYFRDYRSYRRTVLRIDCRPEQIICILESQLNSSGHQGNLSPS